MTERQWKGYLRQARKSLYCARAEQKVFEARIRSAVRDLQDEQPGITFEQCVEILGTPEEAAREYLKGFPTQYVAEYIRWRALYQKLLLCGLIVLLAMTVGYGLYLRFFVLGMFPG